MLESEFRLLGFFLNICGRLIIEAAVRCPQCDRTERNRVVQTAAPIYLTQPEVAEFLRVSERSLERWRVEGSGPRFRRFGRRVVYAQHDLVAWAEGRSFSSTAEAGAA